MKVIDFIKEKSFTTITSCDENEFAQKNVIATKDAQEAVNIAKSEMFNDIKNTIYQDTNLDVNVKEYVVQILTDRFNGYSTL